MNKKIMILGASILQLPAIQQAKKLGCHVVVVDMNPDAVGFNEDGIAKEVISTIDIPAVIEAAERHKIDGIMTLASDMPIRTVAAVSQKMGLVGITEETALKATDKAIMRHALNQHDVPVPIFIKVSNRRDYEEAAKQFNCPFIVKPVDNSGSRGVFKIEDITDAKMITEAYDYSHQHSRNGDVIVEEYMRGPEVSVETLTVDGQCHVIQITDKLTTGVPHFVEIGHSQPTMLSSTIIEQIKNIARAANKAIGITNGPSHTEIIVTEEGPKIVEIGARLGGDCITSHLVPLSTGINMVDCCIKIAIGEKPNIQQMFEKGSAIRYFEQKPGVIKSIAGLVDAERIDGIKQISVVYGVGEKITEINSSASRMGFVIAQSNTAMNAISACEIALAHLTLEIE